MEFKDTAIKGGGGIAATLAILTPLILNEMSNRDDREAVNEAAAFATVTRLGDLKEAYGNHIEDLTKRLDRCEQRCSP
jgi:hypothetical protein